MHTEDEAKKMWCPQAQVSAAADGGQSGDWWNRDASHSPGYGQQSCCIASKCMAWRWLRETPIRGLTATAESKTGIMIKSSDPESPKLGHCGLAGKP